MLPAATAWRRTGPLLLSVARLVPRKGIDTTIASLPTILTRYPNAMYVIVGTGPDRTRLEALASVTGVSAHVAFVGDVGEDELPGYYAASDVFVLPTRTIPSDEEIEGFGIVYLEAAATAVPSVAAQAGGVADAVSNGVTGLLVPPSDPPAVGEAVLRLLDDPRFRARLGWNGRHAVERHFHWNRASEAISAIAWDLLATRPGSRHSGRRMVSR
jgi:phosphatidylinositol alpha-1,6-mannosyltransferase